MVLVLIVGCCLICAFLCFCVFVGLVGDGNAVAVSTSIGCIGCIGAG